MADIKNKVNDYIQYLENYSHLENKNSMQNLTEMDQNFNI